jgi:hypothetical protein
VTAHRRLGGRTGRSLGALERPRRGVEDEEWEDEDEHEEWEDEAPVDAENAY